MIGKPRISVGGIWSNHNKWYDSQPQNSLELQYGGLKYMIMYGMVRVKLANMGQNGSMESLTEGFEHGISQKR